MFVIIYRTEWRFVAIVSQKDGSPQLFTSPEQALKYAMRYLDFNWLIINLEG
jgi:hypothetical protein